MINNNNKLEQAREIVTILLTRLGLEVEEQDLTEGAEEFLKVLNMGYTFEEIIEELDKYIENGDITVDNF